MDANDEDDDVRLQRIAGDLLSDFDGSLESFLFKPAPAVTAYGSTKTKGRRVRARVRSRETARMANLLEHFQELPQLLDVHLARWLPMLADAFLQSVECNSKCSAKANATAAAATAAAFAEAATTSHGGAGSSSSTSSLVMPLQAAVARLLYTVCKVRGEKVVVGFLPVETRHLEPLLGALEAQAADISGQPHSNVRSSTSNGGNDGRDGNEHGSWTWQERYLVLLWLSQLLLAPFDLSTISTGRRGQVADEDDEEAGEEGGSGSKHSRLPAIDGFTWPGVDATTTPIAIPSITLRVLPLAVRYLAVPGKERDAARALLVRIAMRRDMQELGVRQALVHWALGSLDGRAPTIHQPYYYIGTLSFLAGILSAAAGASDMDDALASIFAAVNAVADEDGPEAANAVFAAVRSSALARKMMIKASRAVAVRYIQLLDQLGARGPDTNPGLVEAADVAIETTIGYLLGRLADNDTPVRFAASKALSIITLRLRPDMAAQVSDAVLEALERNVVAQNGKLDLTAVDPLEWHGLMLTLAHLIYRRSPPLDALPAIVRALQRGLAFERRSVSGSATGTNVRDAACFGIWALARRYTTAELLPLNVLQTLATDLVVAGSLDPAGNIRRGSSAALQELIGRHPDIICEGIPLVQAVDYHAVALRSRAVTDVAQRATALAHSMYGVALRDALLGWRGFADAGDAGARRTAAQSFGQVTLLMAMAEKGRGPGTSPLDYFAASVRTLVGRVESLQTRQVEERHGFLLALAAVLDSFPSLVETARETEGESSKLTELCLSVLDQLHQVLHKCKALSAARRPDLLAEAASRLIVSSFPIVQAAVVLRGGFDWTQGSRSLALLSGPALLAEANLLPATLFHKTVVALDSAFASDPRPDPDSASSTTPHTALQAFVNLAAACLSGPNAWLGRQETDVIAAASDAALIVLVALGPSPVAPSVPSTSTPSEPPVPPTRDSLVSFWSSVVCRPKAAAAVSFKARASGSGTTGTGYVFALTKAFSLYEISRTTATPEGSATGDDDPISRALLGRWAADRSIDTRIALLQALAQCPAVLMQRATTASSVSSASVTPAAPGSRFRSILAAGLDDYTTDARGDVGSHVRMHALRATQVLWSQEAVLGEGATPKPAGASILFYRVLRLAAEKLDRVRIAAQATLAQALGGERSTYLQSLPFSSQAYFRCLLGLWEDVADGEGGSNILSSSTSSIAAAAAKSGDGASPSLASAATKWMAALMRGYVTSADTGNEELVVASRAAMVDYIVNSGGGQQQRQSRQQCLWQALLRNMPGSRAAATTAAGKAITPPDRIVVPTLEIIAFLFNAGVFLPPVSTGSNATTTPCHADLLDLSRQVNEAVEKAGSVRKVEACVKVYGAVAAASDRAGSSVTVENNAAGTVARAKLADLLQHPWPRVRNAVVDELWGLGLGQGLGVSLDTAAGAGAGPDSGPAAFDVLKGVDWVAADTAALQALAGELGLV